MKIKMVLFSWFLSCCFAANSKAIQKDSTFKFGDFLFTGKKTMKVDFIVKRNPPKQTVSKGDTLYEDDKYIILGDQVKLTGFGIYKKYSPRYKFSSFKVPLYRGILAQPDFKTDTSAILYRTQIKQQCKREGINFAGHFTFVKWGCGSDCQAFAIVDRINGKINYSNVGRETNFDAVGFKYRSNSNMIILNAWRLDCRKGYVLCNRFFKVRLATWHDLKFKWLPEP